VNDQYGTDYEINSVEGHAEMPEPVSSSLSQRAINGSQPPRYWDRAGGVLESHGGNSLSHALWRAQGKIKPIIDADASNPFTKKRYASLGMLLSTIRPVIHELDLILKQGAGKIIAYGAGGQKEFFLPVWMEVQHAPSGSRDRVIVEVPLSKLDAQAIGIAITYGRRYLLQSYFGVASMDDDAASAVQKRLDKDEEAGAIAGIVEKIKECKTVAELEKWAKANTDGIQHLSEEALVKCRAAYGDRLRELQDASQEPEPTKKGR
jgi:hypothetical protein